MQEDWDNQFEPPARGESVPYTAVYRDTDQRGNRDRKFYAVRGNSDSATVDDVLEFRGNLLYAPTPTSFHPYSHVIIRRTTERISFGETVVKTEGSVKTESVVETYKQNLDHPHYANHCKHYGGDSDRYNQPLRKRLELIEGDLVFFTLDNRGRIDSFGKNVNYLWPSRHSVRELVEPFFPKQDISLQEPLSLAERMFGFSGRHLLDEAGKAVSHPYRGKVRFETTWGPEAVEYVREADSPLHELIRLAPLTAPLTRAKARTLYLERNQDGTSSTYDAENPRMSGRKFYWHQRAVRERPRALKPANFIWEKHLYDEALHATVKKQCPAPFFALRDGTVFTGRIHFDNLTRAELGCLLYALEGGDPGSERHALKIGKGKPRGLGSMCLRVSSLNTFDPTVRYRSLSSAPEILIDEESRRGFVNDFLVWIGGRTRDDGHLRDFDQLHRFPEKNSVRYYPVNFSDYGWLPKPNLNPDEPNSGDYPLALTRARDLTAE